MHTELTTVVNHHKTWKKGLSSLALIWELVFLSCMDLRVAKWLTSMRQDQKPDITDVGSCIMCKDF